MAVTPRQREAIRAIRAAQDAALQTVAQKGTADDVIRTLEIIRLWEPGVYATGDVRDYKEYPYKVFQAHDSTANPGWTPEATPALWSPYHGTTAETALPWRKPTGAHDMYKTGEMMCWTDGGLYRCVADTAYSPAEYAQAWTVVSAS